MSRMAFITVAALCATPTARLAGQSATAGVGFRYFFVGVNARVGWKNDERYGSEFGVFVSPQVRVVVPWGAD